MIMESRFRSMSERPKKRKNVCPHCGRKLWLKDFYHYSNGTRSSWCKECQKQNKRDWYNKTRKVPDGIRIDPVTGRKIEHRGLARRIFWDRRMLDDLKRMYATTKNEDLVDIIGVSLRTLIRKARELGLEKDAEWQHNNVMRHQKMASFEARRLGYPGHFKKGEHICQEKEFKPGHIESEETKSKRVASLKKWFIKHPFAAKERGKKMSETKRSKYADKTGTETSLP